MMTYYHHIFSLKSRSIKHAFWAACLLAISHSPILQAQTLEFEQAYQEVVKNAFEISAAEAEIGARNADRWQASAYPNPVLSVGMDTINQCFPRDDNELFVGVTQLFELGGKRPARIRVAEADECTSTWSLEILKCDLFADLLHAFIDVATAQEQVELANAQYTIACQTKDCIASKVDAGKSSALDLKKAEIACKSAELTLAKQRIGLSKSKKELVSYWNNTPPQFDDVSFPLYELKPLPPLEQLENALSSNPTLAQAHAELVKAWEVYTLERANRFPDIAVQVGVTTEHFTRDPALSFEIDIPLTIFDRNQGNICRASFEHSQALYNKLDTANQLESSLKVVYEEWLSVYEEAMTLLKTILPPANESYQLAEASYMEGKFDYLGLLDARSTLFDIKQQYLDAVAEYHHKRADVLKLTAKCCPSDFNL